MKILYLHQYFLTPDMAGGTRSYEMARRLVANGHEVHIITALSISGKSRGWSTKSIDGVNVHYANIPYSNRMGFLMRVLSFARFALMASVKAISFKADVVFATSTPLTICIPAIISSKLNRCPMVFEVRDLWPDVPIAMGIIKNPILKLLTRWLEKIAYACSRRIVVLSEDMKRDLLSRGINANRVEVIPNGCDIDLFSPKNGIDEGSCALFDAKENTKNAQVLLYPGTIGVVNGVKYLVDVAAHFSDKQNIKVVIIGDGIEREEVIDYAKSRNVFEKSFYVYAPISKNELVSVFKSATAIVSTVIDIKELEANSANKFFDALAAAKPIFINYGGWQSRVIKDNDIGLRLSRNPKEAAEAISQCFGDDEQLRRWSMNSFLLAHRDYSRDLLAAKLEGVLLNAANVSDK